ncbi:MAG: GNAT family N-acetyltransferase [Hyphomicrobiaceae bacterium]
MAITVEPISGEALAGVLPALARLRIEVFRAYPYLYDGSLGYEEQYLAKFAASEGSVVVVARDGEEVVGASTGAPMEGHADAFARPFAERGFDTRRIFYFGESVLKASHRGHGIGHAFFDHREAHARRLGGFDMATFCAVVRPADHPLKPADYRPLDAFWRKRGYEPVEGLVAAFSWKDIDQPAETEKPMQFWMRRL